jgi:hypothetical protein
MPHNDSLLPDSLPGIDVSFDFTSDSPGFWDGFWERNSGLGAGGSDPDAKSPMARRYHQLLWSRQLPNGDHMEMEDGRSHYYLRWNDIYFGSDSITATFRYQRNKDFLETVRKVDPEYEAFVEGYLRKLYTIGGLMLFPSFRMALNQSRGFNARISDRWDLTLECIRRHYQGESSPLDKCLNHPTNVRFFNLFVDFTGFVDFFFLQDCVTDDYQEVKFWLDTPLFDTNPIPKTVEDYLGFIDRELDFVERRNRRIGRFISQ